MRATAGIALRCFRLTGRSNRLRMLIGADGRVWSARELSGSAPGVPEALTTVQERRFILISLNGGRRMPHL
jgi:hypothetical protein